MTGKGSSDLDAAMRQFLDDELVEAALEQVRQERANACAEKNAQTAGATEQQSSIAGSTADQTISPQFRQEIAAIASSVLKIPADRLDVRENMARYGVDSIIVTEIIKRISDLLDLPIAPTVFFEAKHLEELADILYRRYQKTISERFQAQLVPEAVLDEDLPHPVLADAAGQPKLIDSIDNAEIDDEVKDWISRFRTVAASGGKGRAKPETESPPVSQTKTDKETDYEPVAIISMDGLFADSADLQAFERHLRNGDDCISEVPADRWDWHQVYGDPKQGEFTQVKYGGFAPDIDKFDPLFFGMSPKEAELMDPQHRLFIQCVWRLIESAGYAPKSLSGRKVGLFLGINLQDYAHQVARSGTMDALHLTSHGHMFCPNRLSFLLDIHGPSQVIDTACSSSLVALHRAVLSIQHEGCEMAIAGGSNLMISPDMHIMYSKVGMICEDGRCKTFSDQANGYARGDGVGAVLLKSLRRAEQDGDTILAVIRGSSENHGGLSTSLTAPNPKSQAALIVEAHQKAHVDPRSIGYIECHGTGTALGDPIEINGLKMAFEQLHRDRGVAMPETAYCGLGSVKSNIGHAETAAGIAGVIKTVLAIRHQQLYPTLHCDTVNPMIELAQSPFYILQHGQTWQAPVIDGKAQPRRAGVSSFGAGGSNAHVLIEEYQQQPLPPVQQSTPVLILLSAKNEARLNEVVSNLFSFLQQTPSSALPELADIAFTLQVGRDSMAERLALVVSGFDELKAALDAVAHGRTPDVDCYRGNSKAHKQALKALNDDALPLTVKQWFSSGQFQQLAELWVKGFEIDWQTLYADKAFAGRAPRRIQLPTYPFARQRCWLTVSEHGQAHPQQAAISTQLYPLLQQNTSDLAEHRFSSVFTGNEFFLADHIVMGDRVLPGVAYLEMARAAIEQLAPNKQGDRAQVRLKNVVWARPFAVGDQPTALHIGLYPEQADQIAYRIYSQPEDESAGPVIHSQGTALSGVFDDESDMLDLQALLQQITAGQPEQYCLNARQCYGAFKAMGIAYGPGHQGLESVYYSAPDGNKADVLPQVLANISLPDSVKAGSDQFVLHPGLIDSALQACIGLLTGAGQPLPGNGENINTETTASLPFALDELTVLAQPSSKLWVWIRYADGSRPADKVQKLNIDLCDEQGRVCVRIKGFSSRSLAQTPPADIDDMVICQPVWTIQPAAGSVKPAQSWARHLIVLCDPQSSLLESVEQDIGSQMNGAECLRLQLTGAIQDCYQQAAIEIFEIIKQAFAQKNAGKILLQVLVPTQDQGLLLTGLAGLLKTASRENAKFFGQLIELDNIESDSGLISNIIADSQTPESAQIRYQGGTRQVLVWQQADTGPVDTVIPWKDNGVYLITGGCGGLGLLFARQIAAQSKHATVVLSGRSELNEQKQAQLNQLSASGLTVEYRQLDVGKQQDVHVLIAELTASHGRIDGILHCAGLLKDNFIVKKSADEFVDVLSPKVAGTVALDNATAELDLDFFVLFSSAAGAWGSAGQADYAAANAFMDAYAEYRNRLVSAGQRQGHAVAINWPLWADGGMQMEDGALAMMRQNTGMTPLSTVNGFDAFNRIIASGAAQSLVLQGALPRIRQLLQTSAPVVNTEMPVQVNNEDSLSIDTEQLRQKIRQMLLQFIAKLMKFEPEDLDVESEFSDYGFDSITLTDFANKLNQQYRLELTPTVFFEYSTIAEFADWLAREYESIFAKAFGLQAQPVTNRPENTQQPSPTFKQDEPVRRSESFAQPSVSAEPSQHTDHAVAIIGISGRFPMARDLDQFWANLLDGKDCISEIPEDRWDWRALFGDPATEANKTNIKWGGFIDGVAEFDARFFGISPREAELMDPQQRLLMQYVWKAIEDAGYSASSLSGTNTGIFIGTASSGYGEMMAKSGSAIESYSSTGVVGSVGPNRMSYFLDLHGPSEPIETACSSSLVAIHRALSAMADGDCDRAIVGGINLIISPETQISFNKAGMLCQDGRCKTFSSKANGYVRGEGVGMLVLKKLSQAERAGDHIYGVIRGSAENHGGRGNSLTAPNPKAQAELLKSAYLRAGIDPRTVGYIEAHGTGTELGDPIEINGLKSAFKDLYQTTGTAEIGSAYCGLGSVKTNIGHLELAAGVAGVIKVLLQLKHKTLVKSLHCDQVNPYIQLQDSPFYLLNENRPWTPLRDQHGNELPRRAGVSSFGFGGVNAHIVIEEYIEQHQSPATTDNLPSLIVLSAKNQDRLQAYAEQLLVFISSTSKPQESDRAQQILQHTVCTQVADILQIDSHEIVPGTALDEYGFDQVNKSMLLSALQQQYDLEIAAPAVVDQHTIIDIVDSVLISTPVLREQLNQSAELPVMQAVPAGKLEPGFSLTDLAYTLQVGREAMDERLAIMATSFDELAEKLNAFIEGRSDAVNDLYRGQVRQNKSVLAAFAEDEELQEALTKWMQRGKFAKLLDLWVKGLNLDWQQLYGEAKPYTFQPRRISVPGYPFARQRFWIEKVTDSIDIQTAGAAQLHPLVHENVSTLSRIGFNSVLIGNEFFLADHRIQGQKVLPGVAYLEMARAAVSIAGDPNQQEQKLICLQDTVWIKPLVVDQAQSLGIELTANADSTISFEIFNRSDRQLHSQGNALFIDSFGAEPLDVTAMLNRQVMTRFDAGYCYALYSTLGLDYGPAQQAISELYAGNDQVLARLALPEAIAHTLDQYLLHPSLMDAALQAAIGLGMNPDAQAAAAGRAKLSLPFAVETVIVFGACVGSMWAWVRRTAGSLADDRVQKLDIDLCNEQGQVCIQIKGFSSRLLDSPDNKTDSAITPDPVIQSQPDEAVDNDELTANAINYFKQLLADKLKQPIAELRADEALDSYGIDSMMVMELTSTLEKSFGKLSKTLFFEYQTLAELVDYFLVAHRPQLLKLLALDTPERHTALATSHMPAQAVRTEVVQKVAAVTPKRSNTGALDIAVVGLSGRYPQANNIEEFWQNLSDGRDCITEVPKDRWDWHEYYSEDRNQPGRHYSKWGGFIADIDKFDPLFFNISPREAEFMDPQERLFLEHAWMALEDSGYRREDLQKPLTGSNDGDDLPAQVGVYAGVMYGEYQLLGLEAGLSGKPSVTASIYASIANRVSYFLNLHGPSMTVDTMCSSSLTAIHLACQDLKLGRTDLGLAGGVNLSIHPNKYKILSAGQFISSRGHCESFGAGGDGYVPGEGVGVVVLKRLADAERDGDHIYGVIKSSALNHGGKTNGYSVPNPNAQQMVISRALREANIDPRSIGYIEAHGTGTTLGDPIEITGLNKAFAKFLPNMANCWIGSVKSNIGHSESAAGMAGLTKVLLQMREGQIAPSLHSQKLNPNIDFSTTKFQVNQQLREWPRPVVDGRVQQRVAGLSSFGAGGSNAHLLITEYINPDMEAAQAVATSQLPCAFVLSAKTEQQLQQSAQQLLQFCRQHQAGADAAFLRNMAYTLQQGREAMPQRLGFIGASIQDLNDKLNRFLHSDNEGLYIGRARGQGAESVSRDDQARLAGLIAERRLEAVLAAWVKGDPVDWALLYAGDSRPPSRISLPTYPFARERYWLDLPEPKIEPDSTPAETGAVLMMTPTWKVQAAQPASVDQNYSEHRVLFIGSVLEVPGAICLPLSSTGTDTDQCFNDYAVQLFEQIKAVFTAKPEGAVLLQVVIGYGHQQDNCPVSLLSALSALLNTARMENPQLTGQLIELDGSRTTAAELSDLLDQNSQTPNEHWIRYRDGRRQIIDWQELDNPQQSDMPVWKQGGVYLITGGAGGLGLIFAREIVDQIGEVTLILTGRSQLDAERKSAIAALQAKGARVEYRAVDVADQQAVKTLIGSITGQYGGLHGIIHSAGIIQDNFIIKKSAEQFRQVLSAKVSGTVNLDRACRGLKLDFFILFSSVAGAVGNPGQSDYATGNAFMDAYAGYRNRLEQQPALADQPHGHTLSINWPLWQQGGMDIDEHSKEMMWRSVGLRPLATGEGIAALYTGLNSGRDQVMVLAGDLPRLRQQFADQKTEAEKTGVVTEQPDASLLQGKVENRLAEMISDMLKLPLHRIEVDVPLEQYGIDSVAMMKLTNDLEKIVGTLPKTLLFEYPCIDAISAYLVKKYPQPLAEQFADSLPTATDHATGGRRKSLNVGWVEHSETQQNQNDGFHFILPILPFTTTSTEWIKTEPVKSEANELTVQTGDYDIAVIGMSGQFPQAHDLDEFWQNLAQGKDCITEIPSQRWDYRQFFDADKTRAGKSYCKWGGFLDQVDQFDPLFFKISPKEAALLDPQERLFLETVWNLLESSGYQGETLQRLCQAKVGVFAGSMSQQYHAFESDLLQESVVALSSHSSIANRVSYFFNFQGPSIAVDTMCSSALVAIHMACDSLLRGDCKAAIAGGVNLSIHPKKFIGLCAGQIAGSHPDSTSFGDGDGYLPAEAVGAVLLKPLKAAITDNDNIIAVIKSTAINHGGQSNGYSVPNASAQVDLITGNFAKSGIDPRTVSYVESAANGSPLGDAIELNALSEGFGSHTDRKQFCAIGSVKSNIGHAEAASGISQLIKVLLQLQHRQLAPSIKAHPLNPNIHFEQTPFRLQRRLEPWARPVVALDDGVSREYPRRATVSSFGAGGSNAHLIIEEYVADNISPATTEQSVTPQLMLFSAKTAEQLNAVVRQMLGFIRQRPELSLAGLAYTLQTARFAMEYRLALVVDDREQLIQGLQDYLESGGNAVGALYTGNHEQDHSELKQKLSGDNGLAIIQNLLAEKALDQLAQYWVKGIKIVWQPLHDGADLRTIPLPTYPFERKRYWLGDKTEPDNTSGAFVPDAGLSVQDNMLHFLTHTLAQALAIPEQDISSRKTLLDYGVDSMLSAQLRRDFERLFQVKLSARDLLTHNTLAALAEFAAVQAPSVKKNDTELIADQLIDATERLPLSEGQKGLWLLHQMAPEMSAYNIPIALRINGRLEIDIFKHACEQVLQRYPLLAAAFGQENGELYQTLSNGHPLSFEHKTTELTAEAEIIAALRQLSKQPFDLSAGALFRIHVLSSASGEQHYLLLTVHHIIFDGSSAVLLLNTLMQNYRQLLSGAEPEPVRPQTGYDDFVRWQQQFMSGEQGQAQLAYWQQQLSGEIPVLSLPYDYPKLATPRFIGDSFELTLPPALAETARELAKSLQVNLSVIFLGVLQLLLHRYAGERDIAVGMPTSGRPESRFDDVVGYFINMIVIRSRIDCRQPVAEFMQQLQLTVADGSDNADYPFPALLQAIKPERDQAGSPLFQVIYAYQNFIRPDSFSGLSDEADADGAVEFLSGINQEGSHDLSLEVYQGADSFVLKLDYNTDLFKTDTIERLISHYINLLTSIGQQPDAAIAGHKLLSAAEQQQMTVDWNAAEFDYDNKLSVIELFQHQVQQTPENTALQFEGQTISYQELDWQSSRLAGFLLKQGVVEGDSVGVCMLRGFSMMVSMLAIWKAGAVYVPISPDTPEQRLSHVLSDSGIKLLLTERVLLGSLAAPAAKSSCIYIAVDRYWPLILQVDNPLMPQIRPEQAAYIIYTSGSTGQPKGVVIAHKAISHHCQVMRDYYQLTDKDKVLQFASPAVDASLEQVLPGLLSGATVVIRPDELWSSQAFRNNVAGLGLTVIDIPPSYLYELLLDTQSEPEWDQLRSLTRVITGGEALTPETVDLWRNSRMRDCRLINAYGPTETTITSTVFDIDPQTPEQSLTDNIPIGRPLPGESVYILDDYGQPVPVGVFGELHIGGAGLAVGYLNQPELTTEKFIDNPFKQGEKLYKTGDKARWLADGTIQFLGRFDHQVKIRGFRVECGEIEAALQALASVRQAVVMARLVHDNLQLTAFIVPASEHSPVTGIELKQRLAERLPDYMIPASFVMLAKMPLTSGDKVDRKALMQLDSGEEQRHFVAPRTDTEARLVEIWRQVLNIEQVGVYDNFFDLGGHSLLSVRLMAVIEKTFGQALSVSSLFQATDIAGQAELLQQKSAWTPLICLQLKGEAAPLFLIHPVAGNVLCYQELSRCMGEQRPVYGLQAPSVDDAEHPGSIEGLAGLYINAIRTVQAHGPYHLGGWSMGGVIAYEIAGQLQRSGEHIAELTLIESYTPDTIKALEQQSGLDNDTLLLSAFAEELGLDNAEQFLAMTSETDLYQRLDQMLEQIQQAGLPVPDIDQTQLRQLFDVFAANVRALDQYNPRLYTGNIKLLFAERSLDQAETANGGWQSLLDGEAIISTVPGDHYSVMQSPNVRYVAEQLIDDLNEKII